jgi:hypothetical protein
MMNARRTPTNRLPYLNMSLEGDGRTVNDVCRCRSLNDLVKIWDVRQTIPLPLATQNGEEREMCHHNYSDDYFLDPKKFHNDRAAAQEIDGDMHENEDEKKTDDGAPAPKRPKV